MNTNLNVELEQLRAVVKRLEAADAHRLRAAQRRAQAVRFGLGLALALVPAGAVAVDLPYLFQAGDPVIAAELNESFQALAGAIDASVIREDTTIQIGPMQTCAAIQQALDDLGGRSIAGTATVTVELLPGTYACEDSIAIRHRDGARVHIRGAGNNASDVTLTFPPDAHGVSVSQGQALGLLENLTLQGGGGLADGISVRDDGEAQLSNVVVTGFDVGVAVEKGSSVVGTNILSTQNQGGMLAFLGSSLRLEASDAVDNEFDGFVSASGSALRLTNCSAEGNGWVGYTSWVGGSIESVGCMATNNGDGFRAEQSSYVLAADSISSNNTGYGYQAFSGGHLFIAGSHTAVGNGAGETNLAINTPHPLNGAVISQ